MSTSVAPCPMSTRRQSVTSTGGPRRFGRTDQRSSLTSAVAGVSQSLSGRAAVLLKVRGSEPAVVPEGPVARHHTRRLAIRIGAEKFVVRSGQSNLPQVCHGGKPDMSAEALIEGAHA